MSEYITLKNAGLSEDESGEIIAQGFLNLENIGKLKVDTYQREVLTQMKGSHKTTGIMGALMQGKRLPTIVIGMRGGDFNSKGDDIVLKDACYVVDGLQRISGIKSFAEAYPDKGDNVLIGAEIRFGTTKETEKELFHALNSYRTAMSPNVILRNQRDKNRAILTIYGLSQNERDFALYKKVQWNQRMLRGELLTAVTIANVARVLHGRGIATSSKAGGTNEALEKLAEHVGLPTFRHNIKAFFQFLDDAYAISKIEYVKNATPIKVTFLLVMARFISEHEEYWAGSSLNIPKAELKRFQSFPIMDYEIMRLAASGTSAMPILLQHLTEHMNKRRHTGHKLTPRDASKDLPKYLIGDRKGMAKNFTKNKGKRNGAELNG